MRGLIAPLLVLLLLLAIPAMLLTAPAKTPGEAPRGLVVHETRVNVKGVQVEVEGIEAGETTLTVKIKVQPPNPCVKIANVEVETGPGNVTVHVYAKPPEKTVMCIQVLPMPSYYSLTASIPGKPVAVYLAVTVGEETKTIRIAEIG